jgi:ribosomal-protein-alanine N-acetyltransferase
MSAGMSGFSVRSFESRDLGAVATLEPVCNPAPWSAETLSAYAAGGDARFGLVAEADGIVTGYVIVSRAADEAEILQLGVSPDHRRQGIAGILLRKLFARLKASQTRTVYLEVRARNVAARALYGSLGFLETGLRKGYYADGEDAVLYRKALG